MKTETKEEFCSPCLSLIPAALGAGGIAVSGTAKNNKKWKKIVLLVSISVTILSLIIFIWLKSRCQTCK